MTKKNINVELIIEHLKNKISLSEIAKKYGCSRATIWNKIKDNQDYQKSYKNKVRKSRSRINIIFDSFYIDYQNCVKSGTKKTVFRKILMTKYKISTLTYQKMVKMCRN